MENILSEVFGIWFLIGASFVFFMQAGFAMAERTNFLSYCCCLSDRSTLDLDRRNHVHRLQGNR